MYIYTYIYIYISVIYIYFALRKAANGLMLYLEYVSACYNIAEAYIGFYQKSVLKRFS